MAKKKDPGAGAPIDIGISEKDRAAIAAGLVYAWLYVRTGKLWVAVIAHAVTNTLLGAWVIATGNWGYW